MWHVDSEKLVGITGKQKKNRTKRRLWSNLFTMEPVVQNDLKNNQWSPKNIKTIYFRLGTEEKVFLNFWAYLSGDNCFANFLGTNQRISLQGVSPPDFQHENDVWR